MENRGTEKQCQEPSLSHALVISHIPKSLILSQEPWRQIPREAMDPQQMLTKPGINLAPVLESIISHRQPTMVLGTLEALTCFLWLF